MTPSSSAAAAASFCLFRFPFNVIQNAMTAYDEIEIEDMEWNEELRAFTFACPCGDVFQITKVSEKERRVWKERET